MKKTILIFDFDGTIADTHSYIIAISNRLAGEFNYNTIHPHEVEYLKSKTSQEVIQHLNVPFMKIPAILTKAKKEFLTHIAEVKPFDGLKEVLYRLKENGVTMGILSSNSQNNIQKFLANHQLNVFDFINSTSKIWSKDTCLKNLMHKKGFSIENVIYIGDEIRDISAARKLGVRVAAVGWGYNTAEALGGHNPDFLIHTPQELLTLSV